MRRSDDGEQGRSSGAKGLWTRVVTKPVPAAARGSRASSYREIRGTTEAEDNAVLVREVMTAEPVTARVDTHAKEALRLLDEHSITMLPVVTGDARMVGVISEADLIRDRVLPDARSTMLPPDTS